MVSFGGALLFELLKKYNRVRRQALATGLVLLICCFLAFCYCLHVACDPQVAVEEASMWTIQLIMGALVICWVTFILSALLLWLFNGICLYGYKGDKSSQGRKKEEQTEDELKAQQEEERAIRGRARAALRTGRLTLAVSASTFLLVTIFL